MLGKTNLEVPNATVLFNLDTLLSTVLELKIFLAM